MRIAVVYHTTEGHTHEVAERIGARLREQGHAAELVDVHHAPASLAGFDGVIAGGRVHGGKLGKPLADWARDHRQELDGMPSALFSVSLFAAIPDERHRSKAAATLDAFETAVGWRPPLATAFAGAFVYHMPRPVRRLFAWIYRREGLDTKDTPGTWDYTDWEAVAAFADAFLALAATPA